jgi:hypothetical protein
MPSGSPKYPARRGLTLQSRGRHPASRAPPLISNVELLVSLMNAERFSSNALAGLPAWGLGSAWLQVRVLACSVLPAWVKAKALAPLLRSYQVRRRRCAPRSCGCGVVLSSVSASSALIRCTATGSTHAAVAHISWESAFLTASAKLRGCQPNPSVERTNNGGPGLSVCLLTAAVVCLSPLR